MKMKAAKNTRENRAAHTRELVRPFDLILGGIPEPAARGLAHCALWCETDTPQLTAEPSHRESPGKWGGNPKPYATRLAVANPFAVIVTISMSGLVNEDIVASGALPTAAPAPVCTPSFLIKPVFKSPAQPTHTILH